MRLSWKKKDDPTEYGITSEELLLDALCAHRDKIILDDEITQTDRVIRLFVLNDLISDATLRHAAAVRGGA